jgi:hypothetical protein
VWRCVHKKAAWCHVSGVWNADVYPQADRITNTACHEVEPESIPRLIEDLAARRKAYFGKLFDAVYKKARLKHVHPASFVYHIGRLSLPCRRERASLLLAHPSTVFARVGAV